MQAKRFCKVYASLKLIIIFQSNDTTTLLHYCIVKKIVKDGQNSQKGGGKQWGGLVTPIKPAQNASKTRVV